MEEIWNFRNRTFWDMAEEIGDISKINITEVGCTRISGGCGARGSIVG
jgi:hypothetical protein